MQDPGEPSYGGQTQIPDDDVPTGGNSIERETEENIEQQDPQQHPSSGEPDGVLEDFPQLPEENFEIMKIGGNQPEEETPEGQEEGENQDENDDEEEALPAKAIPANKSPSTTTPKDKTLPPVSPAKASTLPKPKTAPTSSGVVAAPSKSAPVLQTSTNTNTNTISINASLPSMQSSSMFMPSPNAFPQNNFWGQPQGQPQINPAPSPAPQVISTPSSASTPASLPSTVPQPTTIMPSQSAYPVSSTPSIPAATVTSPTISPFSTNSGVSPMMPSPVATTPSMTTMPMATTTPIPSVVPAPTPTTVVSSPASSLPATPMIISGAGAAQQALPAVVPAPTTSISTPTSVTENPDQKTQTTKKQPTAVLTTAMPRTLQTSSVIPRVSASPLDRVLVGLKGANTMPIGRVGTLTPVRSGRGVVRPLSPATPANKLGGSAIGASQAYNF